MTQIKDDGGFDVSVVGCRQWSQTVRYLRARMYMHYTWVSMYLRTHGGTEAWAELGNDGDGGDGETGDDEMIDLKPGYIPEASCGHETKMVYLLERMGQDRASDIGWQVSEWRLSEVGRLRWAKAVWVRLRLNVVCSM